jgi:hypothetical protein
MQPLLSLIAWVYLHCTRTPPYPCLHILAWIYSTMPRNLLLLFCPQCTRQPVLLPISRTLIPLLCSSGDVEANPESCVSNIHWFHAFYIRSLLSNFVLLTAFAHSANPDVLAVSESWFRKSTKNSEFHTKLQHFNVKIANPPPLAVRSTAEMACKVLSYFPGLCSDSSHL